MLLLLLVTIGSRANNREKYNFNSQWLLHVGDIQGAEKNSFSDKDWKKVTLPHAFNEDEAFKVGIENMTDTISWYRKHFKLPKTAKGKKVFIEFEGVRQGADFYVNGNHIGLHENGVMAVGFDLTSYLNFGGENVIAVRTDNDWNYKEEAGISGMIKTSMLIMEAYLKMYGCILRTSYIKLYLYIVTYRLQGFMFMRLIYIPRVARLL